MSTDVDITYGGAISVDPEALRGVAVRLGAVSGTLIEVVDAMGRARSLIVDAPLLAEQVDASALSASVEECTAFRGRVDEVVTGTALMADAYELVELRAERDMLAITDAGAVQEIEWRIQDLEESDPRLAGMADCLVQQWENGRHDGLDQQDDLFSFMPNGLGALISAMALVGQSSIFGRGDPARPLSGRTEPVIVEPVRSTTRVEAPSSLADTVRRIPESGDEAQVKVEKYTYADGTTRYVAYVKGTTSLVGDDPWDMTSNVELYAGIRAPSYEATLEALEQAGAQPGDTVDLVGYSQGAMIVSHLANEGPYKVGVVVALGNPDKLVLDDDQLGVQLKHTDDMVNSLSGGGLPQGTGSPDSVIITREARPGVQVDDMAFGAHMKDVYVETAELADASGDVRLEAYQEHLRALGEAESIESTVYRAERA